MPQPHWTCCLKPFHCPFWVLFFRMRHETKNSEPIPPMINVPFIKWRIIGIFLTPSLLNRTLSHYTRFFFLKAYLRSTAYLFFKNRWFSSFERTEILVEMKRKKYWYYYCFIFSKKHYIIPLFEYIVIFNYGQTFCCIFM